MEILICVVVGLLAGQLASRGVGGTGYGLTNDMVIGAVGALAGGLLFRDLGALGTLGGLPGTILVAFMGAVVLLLALRLVRKRLLRA